MGFKLRKTLFLNSNSNTNLLQNFELQCLRALVSSSVNGGNRPGAVQTPLIQALRRQEQAGLCEFKASLAYISNSKLDGATW